MAKSVAPFTPANPQTKASITNLTPSTRSAKPRKRSSSANAVRDLIALPDRYDDGGFSGSNLNRPALERLLSDIRGGAVECVVVYKVDRLSRSLIDFARIIEVFEKHNVSFVSVTQQFNTTNSLGRLTLNILLSFAQFEREIIAERTRDKMSAARRKGKWIGGRPVLGYDIDPRSSRLTVNADEAIRVRMIFQLYLEYNVLLPTVREIDRRGWRTKQWVTRKGVIEGGQPFTKGRLFRLLTNPIYIGKIDFKNQIYDGEHDAIVGVSTWEDVQHILQQNGRNGGADVRSTDSALLKGLAALCFLPRGNDPNLHNEEFAPLSALHLRGGAAKGPGQMRKQTGF